MDRETARLIEKILPQAEKDFDKALIHAMTLFDNIEIMRVSLKRYKNGRRRAKSVRSAPGPTPAWDYEE